MSALGPVGWPAGRIRHVSPARAGGARICVMGGAHHPVAVNAEVIVRTGGGGGWGDPLERNPAAVREDVIEEFISAKAAREQYGVVLLADLSIDPKGTAQMRGMLRAQREEAGQGA